VNVPRYPTGIRPRHRATCKSLAGGRCTCRPAWEASIGSGRTAKVRRTFASQAAAKSWRADALTKLNRGELTAAQSRKIREAAIELIDGMRAGTVRTRSGDVDRYGHLFSGNEEEAAALVDAYLDRIAARREPLA